MVGPGALGRLDGALDQGPVDFSDPAVLELPAELLGRFERQAENERSRGRTVEPVDGAEVGVAGDAVAGMEKEPEANLEAIDSQAVPG